MVDCSLIAQRVASSLAAESVAMLTFWSEAELYDYMNEYAQEKARECALLVERRSAASATVVSLHARAASLLMVSYGNYELSVRSQQEMDAMRRDWKTVADPDGRVLRFIPDSDGPRSVRLWPVPPGTQQVWMVERLTPPDATPAAPQIDLPAAAGDAMELAALGAARAREGKGQAVDIAEACDEVRAILDLALEDYYGRA